MNTPVTSERRHPPRFQKMSGDHVEIARQMFHMRLICCVQEADNIPPFLILCVCYENNRGGLELNLGLGILDFQSH